MGAPAYKPRIESADYSNRDLNGEDFSNRFIVRTAFSKAILRGVSFRGAHLWGCNLDGVEFIDCDLTGAEFHADPAPKDDDPTMMMGVEDDELEPCFMDAVQFKGCKLTDTNFWGACISRASFDDCDLSAAVFSDLALITARFTRCNLAGTNLNLCAMWQDVSFEDCSADAMTTLCPGLGRHGIRNSHRNWIGKLKRDYGGTVRAIPVVGAEFIRLGAEVYLRKLALLFVRGIEFFVKRLD